MDISVVIVSFNVSSFLDQTLATLQEAIDNLAVEVFVVDNASADDSVAMVRRKYPWATLIETGDNLGFARANNRALERVQGEYVLLLNPDTVVGKDTLTTMKAFLDEHPEAGAAGCKVINPDGSLQLACRRGFPTPGVAFYKMIGLSGLFPKSRTFGAYNLTYLDPEQTTEVDAISGSFMMLRKTALDRVGFLDETFFMYGEDLDLCYRIKKDGWKIYYVPLTEIIHFKGESTKTVPTLKSVRDFYTAMRIFVWKHYKKGGATSYIPQWLVIACIYMFMGVVAGLRMINRMRQPLFDLGLLNISLIIGIILRFGVHFENVPGYSHLQWLSIFIVYSTLYMTTFFFLGMYHRYRNDPDRALIGILLGFMFNVFIVNFIKEYNFSRLASFYCWGLNSITISGWRFAHQLLVDMSAKPLSRYAVIVGRLPDAVLLKRAFEKTGSRYGVVGCVEISKDAIRGRELEGLHVLGLIDELGTIIEEYSIHLVIMVGSAIPFSKVLSVGDRFGLTRPDFKFVPELKSLEKVKSNTDLDITMIDIHPGGLIGKTGGT